jgi:hypothetical protein
VPATSLLRDPGFVDTLLMLHRLRARVDVRTIWDREHAEAD